MDINTWVTLLQALILPVVLYVLSSLKSYNERLVVLEENRKVQDAQLEVLNNLVINVAEMNIKLDRL